MERKGKTVKAENFPLLFKVAMHSTGVSYVGVDEKLKKNRKRKKLTWHCKIAFHCIGSSTYYGIQTRQIKLSRYWESGIRTLGTSSSSLQGILGAGTWPLLSLQTLKAFGWHRMVALVIKVSVGVKIVNWNVLIFQTFSRQVPSITDIQWKKFH